MFQRSKLLQLMRMCMFFLPLLVLNVGYNTLESINTHWLEIEQQENAQQKLELLANSSNTSYQIAKHLIEYETIIHDLSDYDHEILINQLKNHYSNIFTEDFPKHKLYTFKSKNNKPELIFHNQDFVQRRMVERVFNHLLNSLYNVRTPEFINTQNERMLKNLFGDKLGVKDIVIQKGKTIHIIHQRQPYKLHWNYISIDKNVGYGYFLLVENSAETRKKTKQIALADFEQQHGINAGFIPLFKGDYHTVLSKRLCNSPLFLRWIKHIQNKSTQDPLCFVKNGPPKPQKTGQQVVYSHISNNSSYLKVIVKPQIYSANNPLKVLNFLFISAFILLYLRGILLGKWIELSLKSRFHSNYLLAASFPIILFGVTYSSYMSQFQKASIHSLYSELELNLRQFDSRKMLSIEEYRKAFHLLIQNERLLYQLDNNSLNDETLKIAIEEFNRISQNLPYLYLFITDANKNTLVDLTCDSFLETEMDLIEYNQVNMLRKEYQRRYPEKALDELHFDGFFDSISTMYTLHTGNKIEEEMERRRLQIVETKAGDINILQLYEIVAVNQDNAISLLLGWDDNALDEQTISNTYHHLVLNDSDFKFLPLQISQAEVKPMEKFEEIGKRHFSNEFVESALDLGANTLVSGGKIRSQTDNYSIVALQSQKYPDLILVGAKPLKDIYAAVRIRQYVFLIIIFLSLFIVFICSRLSTALTLKPIMEIKNAVDLISQGKYNLVMTAKDKYDEIGVLSTEFTKMTGMLLKHENMSKLISDQALSIVKKQKSATDHAQDNYYGVALVTDIRNFTPLCEKNSPSEIVEMLNEYFAVMTDIISSNGGKIYKYIGDSLEAIFPEYENSEYSSINRSFKALIEIEQELQLIQEKRKKNGQFTYKYGFGLSYGCFFSSIVGSYNTRMDVTVISEQLKIASKLEALTIKSDSYPIVVDEKIMQVLSEKSAIFKKIPGNIDAWYLHSFEYYDKKSLKNLSINEENRHFNVDSINKELVETKIINNSVNMGFSKSFFIGAVIIILISVVLLYIDGVKNQTTISRARLTKSSNLQDIVSQFSSENVTLLGFESYFNRMVAKIGSNICYHKTSNEPQIIENSFRELFAQLPCKAKDSAKYALFRFNEEKNTDKSSPELITSGGFSQQEIKKFKKLSRHHWLYTRNQGYNEAVKLRHELSGFLEQFFNRAITAEHLSREFFGRANKIYEDKSNSFFFWQDIYAVKPKDTEGLSYISDINIDNYLSRTAAVLIVVLDETTLLDDPQIVIEGLMRSDSQIALITEKSENMTPDFPKKLLNDDSEKYSKTYLRQQEYVTYNNQPAKIVLSARLPDVSSQSLINTLLVIIILFLIAWSYIVKGRAFISSSLAAKLWLILMLSVSLPFISLITVSSFFLDEELNLKVNQKRNELQNYLDQMERRELYIEPVVRNTTLQLAQKRDFIDAAKNISQDKEKSSISKIVDKWFLNYDKIFSANSLNILTEVGITTSSGIGHLFRNTTHKFRRNHNDDDDARELDIMISGIGINTIESLNRDAQTQMRQSEILKGEIITENLLQFIRTMFGYESFFKLSANINDFSRVASAMDGSYDVLIFTYPTPPDIDFVLIATFVYRHMHNIIALFDMLKEKRQRCFAASINAYGRLHWPEFAYDTELEILQTTSWVANSNIPLSGSTRLNNKPYIIEARPSNNFAIITLSAIRSIQPAIAEIANLRRLIVLLVVFFLLLVLLLAHITAIDLVQPVNSLTKGMRAISEKDFNYRTNVIRSDELGQLCHSFDVMINKLKESSLMKLMISKGAEKQVLNTKTLGSKKDAVLLYIGIVAFDLISKIELNDKLLNDLSEQVKIISDIIINNGGDIDKIFGDKILAVFYTDDFNSKNEVVDRVLNSAECIINSEVKGKLPFPCSIGINAGAVISGFIGSGEKRDHTIIGDAVNTAARIQSKASNLRTSRCLVSDKFYNMCENNSKFIYYGESDLKGKKSKIVIYQLIGC